LRPDTVLDTAASRVGAHHGNPDISALARLQIGLRLEDNPRVAVSSVDLELIGREDELGCLQRFREELQHGPRAFVIRGEAGIGKTTLWRSAVIAAQAEGITVLSTRCVEAELPLALAGLADLVEARLSAVADDLAEPQRAALAVAIGLELPGEMGVGAIVLPRAFTAFVLALVRNTPTLLAVDDIQMARPAVTQNPLLYGATARRRPRRNSGDAARRGQRSARSCARTGRGPF
jgi:hypothetical protein